MDITPQDNTQQPISDDQDLAKALAGVMPDAPDSEQKTDTAAGLNFEETPAPAAPEAAAVTDQAFPNLPMPPELPDLSDDSSEHSEEKPEDLPSLPGDDLPSLPGDGGDLEDIRKDALQELRPLLDKVDLPADEKFNTYLMLIRSTDDRSLIAPAHEAAQAIEDEKVRAEALLNIIKEIDYLSQDTQASAE